MGTYSGNFVKTYATSTDMKPQYPSPSHAGGGPGDVRPQLDAKLAPVSTEYLGTEFPSYDTVGGGFGLWNPLDTHESEGVTYPLYTDDQQIKTIEEVHSDPNHQQGYVRSRYIQPLLQSHQTVYSDVYRESEAPIPPNLVVLQHGKQGWGYPQNYGDVAPRLGWLRQTTTTILRAQNRRGYHYGVQPLTQRDAGVIGSPALQPKSLGSDIAGWVKTISSHKLQRPGVFSDPGIVDDSIMARDQNQSTVDNITFGETVF